ncbi:hypothetical protein HHL08_06275 [Sphingobium sp. AR-3-1]|uniref:Uncharacterized protein n=1 Tax=Sphingobium psychrophilum TaxID=2728834 RepID=A0A7X9WTQ0_9SPHN|nr:hypothetical protein [Sphingobium psychrophilum]NML09756.1 hypothetical protein [Sphingobium psychrophilum]
MDRRFPAKLYRTLGALAGLLALSACLVTPGTFESSLDIRADRSFAFTYKGEILASEMGKTGMTGGAPSTDDDSEGETEAAPTLMQIAARDEDFSDALADGADKGDEAQMQAIAAALTKEKGFRSARYMGNRKFEIDYAITGKLTHAFLFPFNIDAQIILPFVAVELRGDDRVRVKAPGFANGFDKSQGPAGMGGMGSGAGDEAAKALNGRFTMTTDAEIMSQNQEEGAQTTPQGKRIVWAISPLTSDAPAATLRVQP